MGSRAWLKLLLVSFSLLFASHGIMPAAAQTPSQPCAVPIPSAAPSPTRVQAKYRKQLHSLSTGHGVKVAVIDTGVARHPELPRLEPGPDLVSPQDPDPFFDCDFHGTAVAGIIGGQRAGIAPGVSILSIRQSSSRYRKDEEEKGSGTLQTLTDAIDAAVEANAQVINVSVVSCLSPQLAGNLNTGPLEAVLDKAEKKGTVVVAASGNAGNSCKDEDVVYPASFPSVIAVAALADQHQLAQYSLPGTISAPGLVPASLAPGGIWADATVNNGRTEVLEGTSFAAPVITGTVALLRQRYPHATPADIRAILQDAAHPGNGYVDPLEALSTTPHRLERSPRRVDIRKTALPSTIAQEKLLVIILIVLSVGGAALLVQGLKKGR